MAKNVEIGRIVAEKKIQIFLMHFSANTHKWKIDQIEQNRDKNQGNADK